MIGPLVIALLHVGEGLGRIPDQKKSMPSMAVKSVTSQLLSMKAVTFKNVQVIQLNNLSHFELDDVYNEYTTNQFCIILVDCEWGKWGDWSTCSLTCDGGEQTRSRIILRINAFGGEPCIGDPTETRACSEKFCSGKT